VARKRTSNGNCKSKSEIQGLSTTAAKCAASGRDDVLLEGAEIRTRSGNSENNGKNKSEMDAV
jgi:hypothetical protein